MNQLFYALFAIESWLFTLQPCSQGLSSNHPLRRARRDPGLVWSRATLTIENIREGSSVIRQFVTLSFVVLRPPLTAMFNNSLPAEILNTIYSGVYLKVRQVFLETICRGRDVVAIVPIKFMESRSYFNCATSSSAPLFRLSDSYFSTVVSPLNAGDQAGLIQTIKL